MREIKFRAWDDKNKQWLVGYEMPNLGGFSLFGEAVLLGEWSAVLNMFLFDRNGHKVDDLKVMQFTGLHDKNGKEIYEGDIFDEELEDENGKKFPRTYVCFKDGAFTDDIGDEPLWDLITDFDGNIRWEVIGNIHENPELIK